MFASIAKKTFYGGQADQPALAAWRWRYRDPKTGEIVTHSDLLTTAEISAIDPCAELIPGSRVLAAPMRHPIQATR
ncbi:MAG: hypothetical protein ABI564_04825 [Ideonella sp.]